MVKMCGRHANAASVCAACLWLSVSPLRPWHVRRRPVAPSRHWHAGRDRRSARRPPRAISAAGRFWLTFHLPSIAVISISTPTMPFNCADDVGIGRVGHRPWRGRPPSCSPVSAPTWRRSQSASSKTFRRAAHLHDGIVPCRHDLSGLALHRIPRWRDVGLHALEHDEQWRACLRSPATGRLPSPCGRAACPWATRPHREETAAGWRSGPPAPAVISRPSGWARISACWTARSSSRKCGG